MKLINDHRQESTQRHRRTQEESVSTQHREAKRHGNEQADHERNGKISVNGRVCEESKIGCFRSESVGAPASQFQPLSSLFSHFRLHPTGQPH